MAEVPQSDPCRECPFRKNSLKGYVGNHAGFYEILQLVHFDQKFPCHVRVNALQERIEADYRHGLREADDDCDIPDHDEMFLEASERAPWCTGALAYMNNTAKRVDDPSAARAARMIGRRDDVFASPKDAMIYHDDTFRMLTPPGTMPPVIEQTDAKSSCKKKRR